MASKTPNLGLIKPDIGEFTDSWHIPLNKNFDLIDAAVSDLQNITDAAKGTAASLDDRLSVSLNANGSLKDVPEIAKARNSTVYGADDGTTNHTLDERIERGDREVFDGRAGSATLLDAGAFAANDFVHNCVVSAPTNYLTFTGANVKVDGSFTRVVANINGYKRVVRRLMETTISGAAGDYYLYLDKNLAGEIVVDRTAPLDNTGATGVDGSSKLRRFSDVTQNFVTSGVQPGDILEITTTGSVNKYQYIVTGLDGTSALFVQGLFESAQAALNYKITNPLAPSLSFTGVAHAKRFEEETDRIYIGKCVFDGANVTSVTQYALKGRYEEWFSVTPLGGDYEITALHKLGYFPSKISLYASQANDYSQALEPLAPAVASGAGVSTDRGAIVDMTDSTIRVKNPTNGIYYKSYGGVSQTSGFLLVVAER